MAEGPKITRNDDGLYVRCEFDAHYVSDEDAKRIRGYIDQLQAENAKLRELVDILCFCMQIHKRCDDCRLNGAKGELGLGHDPLLACDGLHEMLKELGIEVY